jgi:hypothetical protein
VPRDRRAVTICSESPVLSQVSGEHVQADWSGQAERHRVIVNVAPGIAVKPFDWPYPRPEATPLDVRHGCQELTAGRKVGGYCLASSAWRFEQGGDFSDGFGAWAPYRIAVRGLRCRGFGHDQLQGDALLAEVGRCRVAELVQVPPGVPGEQDPGAVIAEPGPSGGRAQVPGRGAAGGSGGGARTGTPARPGGRG